MKFIKLFLFICVLIFAGIIGASLQTNIQNSNISTPSQTQTINFIPKPTNDVCPLFRKWETGTDYDCSDFETHDVAQDFYDHSIECFGYDYFRLDGDHDGIACELLY